MCELLHLSVAIWLKPQALKLLGLAARLTYTIAASPQSSSAMSVNGGTSGGNGGPNVTSDGSGAPVGAPTAGDGVSVPVPEDPPQEGRTQGGTPTLVQSPLAGLAAEYAASLPVPSALPQSVSPGTGGGNAPAQERTWGGMAPYPERRMNGGNIPREFYRMWWR